MVAVLSPCKRATDDALKPVSDSAELPRMTHDSSADDVVQMQEAQSGL